MKPATFKEAYGTLQQHAKSLRDQTEPNIDDLLTIVTESVAAYKVCQTRIDAVEKALEKALNTAHQESDGHGSTATKPTDGFPPEGSDPEDIPF